MKIEPGKLYKTRGGQKARIYAVDTGETAVIHGAIFFNGQWGLMSWCSKGSAYVNAQSHYDLIEEWTEPKKTKELWLWVFYHEVDERYYLDRNWMDETEAKTWAEYNNLKLVGKALFCKEPLVVEE
jgi:hypothetical protein